MTDVSPEGRITPGCAGLYRDEHVAAWKRIVDFVHRHSAAKIGIQLAHAGRKGSMRRPWEGADRRSPPPRGPGRRSARRPLRSAPVPRAEGDGPRRHGPDPRPSSCARRGGPPRPASTGSSSTWRTATCSRASSRRSRTPRRDDYGGALENRMRFPLEVFDAVRAAWPAEQPISVRISATDWMPDGSGITPDDAVVVARELKRHGCDVVDVSSAATRPPRSPSTAGCTRCRSPTRSATRRASR